MIGEFINDSLPAGIKLKDISRIVITYKNKKRDIRGDLFFRDAPVPYNDEAKVT